MPIIIGTHPDVVVPIDLLEETYDADWTDPTGQLWPLTDPSVGWHTLDEVSGHGAAPIRIVTDDDARGGVLERHTQPLARYIVWPMRVQGDQHSQFLARWRQIMQAFTMTSRRGPGTLRYRRPDGTSRIIRARYSSGFEGQGGQGWWWGDAPLILMCEDPYWLDTRQLTATATFTDTALVPFFTPYPSFNFAQTLGETANVTNPGDIEAWPTWTITGPADAVTATNHTTGETWTITPPGGLGDGDALTIVSRPSTVTGPAGEKWWGYMNNPTAVLWHLEPGVNAVEFTFTGSGGNSTLVMSFTPRYESA